MNWVQVIGELASLGYTQPKIAEFCKCGQATISDLARGETKDPRHSIGQALAALLEIARREAHQKAGA